MSFKRSINIVLVLLLLVLFFLIFTYSISNPDSVASADGALPVVSLSSDGIPSNNAITVTINLSASSSEDVNVRVATRDYSAVSGTDYESVDTTFTLSAGAKTTSFKVSVKLDKTAGFNVTVGKVSYVRQFYVKIISVSENVTISEDKNSVLCNTLYSHTYKATKGKTTYYFDEYAKNFEWKPESMKLGEFWKSGNSHTETKSYNFDSAHPEVYSDFTNVYGNNMGIANLYLCATGKLYCKDALQWDAEWELKVNDSSLIKMEIDGYWGTNSYNMGKLRAKEAGSDIEYDGHTSYPSTNDKTSYYANNCYHVFGGNDWYKAKGKCSDTTVRWHINGGYGREAYDWTIQYKVADIKPPEIVYWYIDEGILEGNNNIIYLRVRFDEPVQVNGSPTVVCGFNGSSRDTATFEYCGGSMTDTLVFKLNVGVDTFTYASEVRHMLPLYIENQDAILDFGYDSPQGDGCHKLVGASSVPATSYWKDTSANIKHADPCALSGSSVSEGLVCKFDPRQPKVLTDADEILTTSIIKTFSKNIQVGSMANDGSLYYEWSTEKSINNITNKASRVGTGTGTSDSVYFTVTASGLSGEQYLHLQAISKNNKKSLKKVIGPFKFDNSPYTVSYYDSYDSNGNPIPSDEEKSGYPFIQAKNRSIQIKLTENYITCDSGVNQIYAVWSYDSIWTSETKFEGEKLIYDYSNTVNNGVKDLNNPTALPTDHELLKAVKENDKNIYNLSIYVDAQSTFGMGDGISDKFYVGFVIIDKFENTINKYSSKPIAYEYYFDTRVLFNSTTRVTSNPLATVDSIGVYDYSVINPEIVTTFETTPKNIADILVKKPSISKTEYQPYTDFFEATYASSTPTSCTLKLKTNNENAAGYYEISIKVNSVDGFKYTMEFPIYYTNNKQEVTTNYKTIEAGQILTNQVYMVRGTYFYNLDNNGDIQRTYYGGERQDIIFSDVKKATEYLKFLEYQDMSLVPITDSSMADRINSNSDPTLQKAETESTVCAEGQVWIKYKRSIWKDSTSSQDWGLYWYSNNSTVTKININNFTLTIINAIDDTVNGILERWGKNTYLNSSTGYLTKAGTPYTYEGQIHPYAISKSESLRGSEYTTALQFSGDPNIYSPFISYDNKNYTLASTIEWNYSKYSKSFIEIDNAFVRLNESKGTTLKSQVYATGVYKIREIDEYGVREYNVYIDYEAPTIVANLFTEKNPNGVVQTYIDRPEEKEYTVAGQKITITGMKVENDTLAYFVVYKTATAEYVETITYEKLLELGQKGGYTLEKGRYYLEVYDRTGNHYTIYLLLNATKLEPYVTENVNVSITLNIPDRVKSDINIFEVKLDGKKIDVDFDEKVTLKASGIYHFLIVDWYGNTAEMEYTFERRIPDVSWSYLSGEKMIAYVPNKTGQYMTIKETGSQSFNVVTSSKSLALTFETVKGYSYEFIVNEEFIAAPSFKESFQVETTTITITSKESWAIKVWYTAYPDIYVTYKYVLDETAPQIFVGYLMKEYQQAEEEQVRKDIEHSVDGQILKADSILYSIKSQMSRTITDGSSVTADFLDVNLVDASGIESCVVTLDGKEYMKFTKETLVDNKFTLTKNGKYVIEATDELGNVAKFTFKNVVNNGARYFVDNKEISIGNNLLNNVITVDDKLVYNKIEYGNQAQTIIIPANTEVYLAYLISLSTGSQEFIMFHSSGIEIFKSQYIVAINHDSEEGVYEKEASLVMGSPIFSMNTSEVNKWSDLGEFLGLEFKVMIDSDNNFQIRVLPRMDGTLCTIEAKIIIDQEIEPAYVKTILSSYQSDILINTVECEKVTTNKNGQIICLNKPFVLEKVGFAGEIKIPNEVTSIKYGYSEISTISEMKEVYKDGKIFETSIDKDGNEIIKTEDEEGNPLKVIAKVDGFYKVEITNAFNNVTTYIFHISFRSQIITYSQYTDGTVNTYSTDYEDTIGSNETIAIEIYSNSVKYSLTRNGVTTKPTKDAQQEGYRVLQLTAEGKYVLTITDEFGNVFVRDLVIKKESINIPEDIVYGWNEKALRRSDNYTNNKLSLDLTRFNNIKFVSQVYDGKEYVIYNDISEKKVLPTSDELENVICTYGNGEYTIVFRDEYGNKVTQKVQYREDSTIVINRLTRNSVDQESYDLTMALTTGVYSNNTVTIDTVAKKARLIVDGSETTFPKTIQFMTDVKIGKLTHQVNYLDEYGFEYAFKVILLRQDLKLELDQSVQITEIDTVDVTRNSIIVKYDNETTTTYTINNGKSYAYKLGDVLHADGVYRFTETDFAGNVATLTVKKDTMVEFKFYEGTDETPITNGIVVNDNSVTFTATNGDDSYIKKIYKDGQPYDNLTQKGFSDTGRWEFVLADKIGNETYFSFTIISHRLNSFEYTTPYNFFVSQIWFNDGSGLKLSYLHAVETLLEGSKFKLTESGTYEVNMKSKVTGEIVIFTVIIDTSNPPVSLEGCQNGETTVENIKLSGLQKGDKVYVYKDGELLNTYNITLGSDGPEISDGGKYKIVVLNEAGNETVLEFTRKHVANTAGSVLIILAMVALAIGLFIGLLLRNKSRTDK